MCLLELWFFSGYMNSSGIAESYGRFIPSFLRNLPTVFQNSYIPPTVQEGALFSTSSPVFIACRLLRRRQWHPTPVLLPGKSHGQRGLEGCSPWGRWVLDTTELLHLSLFTFMHWRRKWQPTPVFLPGESQGWGSVVAAIYGVTQSWTRLKWLSSSNQKHS